MQNLQTRASTTTVDVVSMRSASQSAAERKSASVNRATEDRATGAESAKSVSIVGLIAVASRTCITTSVGNQTIRP